MIGRIATAASRIGAAVNSASTRAVEHTSSEPLLDTSSTRPSAGIGQAQWHSWKALSDVERPSRAVRLDWAFVKQLWKLLVCVRALPAVLLVALSVAEALATSAGGNVLAKFYTIFLDHIDPEQDHTGDRARFVTHLARAAALYLLVVSFNSAAYLLGQWLSVAWRRRLTAALHDLYFHRNTFWQLSLTDARPVDALPPTDHEGMPEQHEREVDNPDQRMTRDVELFCSALEKLLRRVAAAPFGLALYGTLACSLFHSLLPLLAAAAFFGVNAALHRVIAARLAASIYAHEQAEGCLRAAHMHVVTRAAAIAAWEGGPAERVRVDGSLRTALAAQLRMALLYSLQLFATQVSDYGGSLVNYAIVGWAVFTGLLRGGAGEAAGRISAGSFYTIMLIHSFTLTLDACQQLAQVAGYSARICDLFDAMASVRARVPPPPSSHDAHGCLAAAERALASNSAAGQSLAALSGASSVTSAAGTLPLCNVAVRQEAAAHAMGTLSYLAHPQRDAKPPPASVSVGAPAPQATRPSFIARLVASASSPRLVSGDLDGQGSEMSTLRQRGPVISASGAAMCETFRQQAQTLEAPHGVRLVGGAGMDVSVHSVGTQQLRGEIGRVFPDAVAHSNLLAVLSFQPLFPAGSPPPDPAQSHPATGPTDARAARMDVLLQQYCQWEGDLRRALQQKGFWSDSIDPRTGRAMHGTAGAVYSECVGAQVFLGYDIDDRGVCPLAVHPHHGSDTYPVSLFTCAPLPVVRSAIRAVDISAHSLAPPAQAAPTPHSSNSGSDGSALAPDVLLSIDHLDVPDPCAPTSAPGNGSIAQQDAPPSQLDMLRPLIVRVPALLLWGFNLSVTRGRHVLVRGASASGKTTLLRAIWGQAPCTSGRVHWGERVSALCVPQDALLLPGDASLAAQVTYPDTRDAGAPYLRALLEAVECGSLLDRCERANAVHTAGRPTQDAASSESVCSDANVHGRFAGSALSGGEAQRLMLARVLHARPDVALLDEAMSALPADQAARLVRVLQEAGITLVLVSHAPEMTPLFDVLLTLAGDGSWRCETCGGGCA